MKRQFIGADIHIGRHIKRCSTSLAIREMQIKTRMRYYYKPIIIDVIKYDNNKC